MMKKKKTCESLAEVVSVITSVTVTFLENAEIRYLPGDNSIKLFLISKGCVPGRRNYVFSQNSSSNLFLISKFQPY